MVDAPWSSLSSLSRDLGRSFDPTLPNGNRRGWQRRRIFICVCVYFILEMNFSSCLTSSLPRRNRSVSFTFTTMVSASVPSSTFSSFSPSLSFSSLHCGDDGYKMCASSSLLKTETTTTTSSHGNVHRLTLYHSVNRIISSSPSKFTTSTTLLQTNNNQADEQTINYYNNQSYHRSNDDDEDFLISGYRRPKVNWYPGHIAKAERLLSETLKSVDVVIEVRDARAPKATAHPNVASWSAGRPRVVVLTHLDAVTSISRESWRRAYARLGADGERIGYSRRDDYGVGGVGSGVGIQLGGDEKNRNVQWRKEQRKLDISAGDESNNFDGEEKDDDIRGEGVEEVLFVDAKRGQGTHAITRAVYRAGRHVNERRHRRGLNDRPLRVGIIGFPNVGKSALINRLLGRRRAKTANTPGVTRSLQWIRVATDKTSTSASGASSNNRSTRNGLNSNNSGGTQGRKSGFELLDSPGIIPSDMIDQSDALLLAACNSIGVGAYDNQAVAAYLCDRIQALVLMGKETIAAPQWRMKCKERYGFDPLEPLSKQNIAARWGSERNDGTTETWIAYASTNQDRLPTGEDMLFIVADNTCRGDPENAARKILQDFRDGRMGPVALQLAPDDEFANDNVDRVQMTVHVLSRPEGSKEDQQTMQKDDIKHRAMAAMDAASVKGIDLPPVVTKFANQENLDMEDNSQPSENEIGKGLFDGW